MGQDQKIVARLQGRELAPLSLRVVVANAVSKEIERLDIGRFVHSKKEGSDLVIFGDARNAIRTIAYCIDQKQANELSEALDDLLDRYKEKTKEILEKKLEAALEGRFCSGQMKGDYNFWDDEEKTV